MAGSLLRRAAAAIAVIVGLTVVVAAPASAAPARTAPVAVHTVHPGHVIPLDWWWGS